MEEKLIEIFEMVYINIDREYLGLCSLITFVSNRHYPNLRIKCFEIIRLYKPVEKEDNYSYWWPIEDREIRKEVVKDILEKLKNKQIEV